MVTLLNNQLDLDCKKTYFCQKKLLLLSKVTTGQEVVFCKSGLWFYSDQSETSLHHAKCQISFLGGTGTIDLQIICLDAPPR